MANMSHMIYRLEREARHDGKAPERMSHILPILVRAGAFLTLLSVALVQIFHIDGGSLVMPISFAVSFSAGVLVAVVAWQPHRLRRRILAVIIGSLAMTIIVVFAWRYTISLLDVRLPQPRW